MKYIIDIGRIMEIKIGKISDKEIYDRKVKLGVRDVLKNIMKQNKKLIDITTYEEDKENYINMMNRLSDACKELDKKSGVVYCPEELVKSFILAYLSTGLISTGYQMLRASELIDYYFDRNDLDLCLSRKSKLLFVIVDLPNYSEYNQRVVNQLINYRKDLLSSLTIVIYPVSMTEAEMKFNFIESNLFNEEGELKDNWYFTDIYQVRSKYLKKGKWTKKSNRNRKSGE